MRILTGLCCVVLCCDCAYENENENENVTWLIEGHELVVEEDVSWRSPSFRWLLPEVPIGRTILLLDYLRDDDERWTTPLPTLFENGYTGNDSSRELTKRREHAGKGVLIIGLVQLCLNSSTVCHVTMSCTGEAACGGAM